MPDFDIHDDQKTDIGDREEVPVSPKTIEDDRHIPYCQVHFVRMASYTSTTNKTFYRCRVEGCREKSQRARRKYRIPSKPQCCPRCSDDEAGVEVACVVDCFYRFKVHFVCPNHCGFNIDIERPDIERQIRKYDREQLNKRYQG